MVKEMLHSNVDLWVFVTVMTEVSKCFVFKTKETGKLLHC